MKISALESSIYTHGRIQIVTPDEVDQPVHFEVSQHIHEPVTGAAEPPKLQPHPTGNELRKRTGQDVLQSIPVRVLFDRPEHNVMARYEAWSDAVLDMPVCIGDGEKASVLNPATGVRKAHVCKGPQLCVMALSNGLRCSITTRMPVIVGKERFELRTNSAHTYRALMAQMRMLFALHGGLRHLHLNLKVWTKSLRASSYKRFGCATLELCEGSSDPMALLSPNPALDAYGEALLQAWKLAAVPTADDAEAGEKIVLELPPSPKVNTRVPPLSSPSSAETLTTLFRAPLLASQEQGAAQMI